MPNRKTIVSLAPADLKKAGAHYDLAIALGLLTAVGVCRPEGRRRFLIAGELSLAGKVLPISGALLMALAAAHHELDGIILPSANAWEAQLAGMTRIAPVDSLADAVAFLSDGVTRELPAPAPAAALPSDGLDMSEVRGQPFAKRGLEIAAAGNHHVALWGPPGTGKTMLAERLPTILPPLASDEALEVLRIRSSHGLLAHATGLPSERPFRAPHHSASYAGLIGGGIGGTPRLGEISLAHRGVLFLDEMAEFRRDAVEGLRQPLESGFVRIVRAGVSIVYPARFQLVAAFNPCPCGSFGHPTKPCICGVAQLRRYRGKLSGPLLDRIDLHVEVGPPPHAALIEASAEEPSSAILARVHAARARQAARYGLPGRTNAELAGRAISRHCALEKEARSFLALAAAKHDLTGRALHRVMKVARTIADLAGAEAIAIAHLAEALQFRPAMEEV
jgi:magnesium chelatase family protein